MSLAFVGGKSTVPLHPKQITPEHLEGTKFDCLICKFEFSSNETLGMHQNAFHSNCNQEPIKKELEEIKIGDKRNIIDENILVIQFNKIGYLIMPKDPKVLTRVSLHKSHLIPKKRYLAILLLSSTLAERRFPSKKNNNSVKPPNPSHPSDNY